MATVTIPDAMLADLEAAAAASGEEPNAFAVARLDSAIKTALSAADKNRLRNGSAATDEIRAALQPFRTYDNADEIIQFLEDYPDVTPALKSAREAVVAHFGVDTMIYLIVVTDPEGDDAPALILDILADMTSDTAIDQALEKLAALSIDWRNAGGTRSLSFDIRDTSVAERK
jgi:hypothetical protein